MVIIYVGDDTQSRKLFLKLYLIFSMLKSFWAIKHQSFMAAMLDFNKMYSDSGDILTMNNQLIPTVNGKVVLNKFCSGFKFRWVRWWPPHPKRS